MNKQKSQLKTGILLNYLNMILGNLVPVLYTPVMLRLLGKSEYGLYKLSSSVTGYLSLMSLGIGAAIIRYLIKARTEQGKDGEEKILGLFVVIFRLISLISLIAGAVMVACLGIFYSDSLTDSELFRMRILVGIMACNTALSFVVSPYVSAAQAHERFNFVQLMNILSTCLVPALNIVALYMGFASIGMAVVSLAVNLIIRILYVFYIKKSVGLKPCYKGMPTGIIKEILLFSFWVFLASIVDKLYNVTDTVLIGMIPALATTGVAVYNVGTTFNQIVFSVSNGLSSVLAPRANKMVFGGATGEQLTDTAIKVGRIQGILFGLIASGFIAFGRPFVYYYAGADYSDAYWIAVILIIPYGISLVQTMCLSIVVAQNKHRFRSIVYLVIAIVNVVGTWFAMKKWGIVGAAAVTAVAFVLGQGFAMNWFYHKRTGLNMIRFWKKTGVVFIIPAVLCAVAIFASRFIDFYKIPVFAAGVAVYIAVYFLLSWLLIMDKYEKNLILSPFKKIYGKLFANKASQPKKEEKIPLPDKLLKKSRCCGCHACANICPSKCIAMNEDGEGFLYPSVDKEKCVDCGMCKRVCPILAKKSKTDSFKAEAFAAYNKDEAVRLASSSGGVFSLLAQSVIDKGGVVVGAGFTEDFSVEHMLIDNKKDLSVLRKSKYMQSRIGQIYKTVQEHLESGKLVLFTGTPCQVAGLRSFLQKSYDNLICQDSVCHGVPSAKLFKAHCESLKPGEDAHLTGACFRDKSNSWKRYSLSLDFSDGTSYSRLFTEDGYMKAFVNNLSLRPSCYNCSFKGVNNRLSDITLADFWGIEGMCPEMDDDKGTSLVIVNTQKGREIFDSISDSVVRKRVDVKPALRWNSSAYDSAGYSPDREAFLDFENAAELNLLSDKYLNK